MIGCLGLRIIIQFEATSSGGIGRWEDWRAGMPARRELDNIIDPLCDDDEGTWRWERRTRSDRAGDC